MSYRYDVSIVVVNYNGKKYLKNLFDSLIKMDCKDISYEIVLVDNASSDDSIGFLQSSDYCKKLDLKIVENKENQGFAEGNNTGVKASEGKYVVFLNSDTAVTKDWLTQLYSCMVSNNSYGMVASKLLFFYDFIKIRFNTKDNITMAKCVSINGQDYVIDNKFCKNLLYEEALICFGHTEIAIPLLEGIKDYTLEFSFMKYEASNDNIVIGDTVTNINSEKIKVKIQKETIDKLRYAIIQNAGSGINENYDGYDIGMGDADAPSYNVQKELSSGCGAAIMVKKEDFDEVGGFDQRFFMYYEDTDLSFKIKNVGKKIIYCPNAVVRHIHTGSSKEWSPFFAYHVYRNKLLFIYKDISKAIFLKLFFRQFVSAIIHKDKLKLRATIDSFRIAVFNQKCIY